MSIVKLLKKNKQFQQVAKMFGEVEILKMTLVLLEKIW